MNVVFIVSDSLRRDHLGCYGNDYMRTPNIDRLAEGAVVLDRYYCASFPTVPARADYFLGRWTYTDIGWAPMPSDEVTLADILRQNGYRTAGVVDTPFFIIDGYGYDKGFDEFVDIKGQLARSRITFPKQWRAPDYDYFAPKTFLEAEKWLERLYKDRFFLYIDTWDPHEPWNPPAWYTRLYRPDYNGKDPAYPCYGRWQDYGLTREDVEIAHACYCGEVTMVDRCVGRLLERIEALGIADDTTVIFTSDHGFYFGEHGGLFGKLIRKEKGTDAPWPVWKSDWIRSPLYEEIVRIPFMARVPGRKPGRSSELISAVDVMPTVLELAGIAPPGDVQGESFAALLRGEKKQGRDLVVSSMAMANPGQVLRVVDHQERRTDDFQPATITTAEWSFLYSARGEPHELYHLPSDPAQDKNVAPDNPAVVGQLHQEYVAFLERAGVDETYLLPRRHI